MPPPRTLEFIDVKRDGSVATLTLRRGEKNLLDAAMTRELVTTLRALDAAPEVGAIVITGSGQIFCGGADGAHIRSTGTAEEFAEAVVELFEFFPSSATPVIAAVNGDALAGGFGLLCSADVVIATKDAKIGTIEATLGTWPAIAQGPALRRVPVKAAITNILTGDPFDAERALELGIIDEAITSDQLAERTAYYASAVQRSGGALQIGLPLMRAALDQEYSQALRSGADGFIELFGG